MFVLNSPNLKFCFFFPHTNTECKSASVHAGPACRSGRELARPRHAGAPSRRACGDPGLSPVQRLPLQMASLCSSSSPPPPPLQTANKNKAGRAKETPANRPILQEAYQQQGHPTRSTTWPASAPARCWRSWWRPRRRPRSSRCRPRPRSGT